MAVHVKLNGPEVTLNDKSQLAFVDPEIVA